MQEMELSRIFQNNTKCGDKACNIKALFDPQFSEHKTSIFFALFFAFSCCSIIFHFDTFLNI